MRFVVKNTTKWRLIDLVAPHSCRGCGLTGAVLCERCKIYNKERQKAICPLCRMVVAQSYENGGKLVKCPNCETEMLGLFAVGWREGVLKKLVSELKYESVRAVGEVLAEMLDETIPDLSVVLPEVGSGGSSFADDWKACAEAGAGPYVDPGAEAGEKARLEMRANTREGGRHGAGGGKGERTAGAGEEGVRSFAKGGQREVLFVTRRCVDDRGVDEGGGAGNARGRGEKGDGGGDRGWY